MIAVYQGQCVHLLQTVAGGDCGIDVCTMILGWERTTTNRDKVRRTLCNFASKNRANRALIWLMHSQGEICAHMGLHALNASFCELLEMHGHQAAFAGHHGDGVGIVEVNHHGSDVAAMQACDTCIHQDIKLDYLRTRANRFHSLLRETPTSY